MVTIFQTKSELNYGQVSLVGIWFTRALHHCWNKSEIWVILRTCEFFYNWRHIGPAPPGRKCPGTKWWCGSETTLLVTPTVTAFLWHGGSLEVISWKSRRMKTDAWVILFTGKQLHYPKSKPSNLETIFWNYLILKVLRENWKEKKNCRQVGNLPICFPPEILTLCWSVEMN